MERHDGLEKNAHTVVSLKMQTPRTSHLLTPQGSGEARSTPGCLRTVAPSGNRASASHMLGCLKFFFYNYHVLFLELKLKKKQPSSLCCSVGHAAKGTIHGNTANLSASWPLPWSAVQQTPGDAGRASCRWTLQPHFPPRSPDPAGEPPRRAPGDTPVLHCNLLAVLPGEGGIGWHCQLTVNRRDGMGVRSCGWIMERTEGRWPSLDPTKNSLWTEKQMVSLILQQPR